MAVISALLLLARLLLAGVFALAGVTKLADAEGSRRAVADFGVPPPLANLVGIVLPLTELIIAAALIPVASAPLGALGALLLLALFIGAIGVSLLRGRRPDCHCFGQLSSKPVGWQTIARNGVLGAVAAFVVFAGGSAPNPSIWESFAQLTVLEKALALGVVALGVQNALLLRRLRLTILASQPPVAPAGSAAPPVPTVPSVAAGHPVGAQAPIFALESLGGENVSLDFLRAFGRPVVLIFTDPACGPCNALLPQVALWQRDQAEVFTTVLVSRGTPEANRVKTDEYKLANVLLQRDREVSEAYRVFGTPSAVLIRPDATIASRLAQGEPEIRQLVASVPRPKAPSLPGDKSRAPGQLDPAPDFQLQDIDGTLVTLDVLRGRSALLLFWNPGCGYCQRMLEDLRVWEKRPLDERAQLLVISTGTIEDIHELGVQSPIARDPNFTVAPRYGVHGTPSALLIDAEGRVASDVAVGGPAILALIGQPESPHLEPATVVVDAASPPPVVLLPDAKPCKQECVEDELLSDGSLVLYNGCTRQVLTLNGTAALVWDCCDGEHDATAIARELREVFPGIDAERDVREMLNQFLEARMIAPGDSSEPGSLATAVEATT